MNLLPGTINVHINNNYCNKNATAGTQIEIKSSKFESLYPHLHAQPHVTPKRNLYYRSSLRDLVGIITKLRTIVS